jgi:hypothetical protein
MANQESIRSMLTVGQRPLSSGRVGEVVALIQTHPQKAAQLFECLWDEELGVVLRAVDALEKVSRERLPALDAVMDSWKAPLLGLLNEATTNKLRWHLALIVPRLTLTTAECHRAAEILQTYLEDSSSVVKTCALQGLAELTRQDSSLRPLVLDLLRILTRSGTPAMRARGRMLLKRLETELAKDWPEATVFRSTLAGR